MGENGAGKSTFMKILMGLLAPDAGEVWFEGERLTHTSVHAHLAKGIAMIHQEILAVPALTIAQNIFLGRETKQGFWRWLNDTDINQKAAQLLRQVGLSRSPQTPMKDLSVAEMQMVEIAKAISQQAKVIIMDEPTSAITDKEVTTLFGIIRELKNQGVAILYISHKMDEIEQIADRVTVLRDGHYVATEDAQSLTTNALIAMMVGREIATLYPPSESTKGEVVLSVENLSKAGKFENVNFEVHAGEVLGMAGLMGAGRTEVARALYGLDPADSGQIALYGQATTIRSPKEAIRQGIGYVSEDRKGWGFVPMLSVKENLSLSSLRQFARNGWINTQTETENTEKMAHQLRIKAANMHQKVTFLSGGNQQKVVLGKVLLASPQVVILDEPTRGVDVGAKFEIYTLIRQLTQRGLAVIVISSELPEILGLCDRIVVLSKGKQTALLAQHEATQEKIMHYAVH
jgi:inositol transport system ATP-binding protein